MDASPAHDEAKDTPAPPSGKRCRELTSTVIRALLGLVDEVAVDGVVAQRDIHRIAEAILAAEGPLAAVYTNSEQKCAFAFHRAAIECQRRDVLGRLAIQPLAALLDQPEGIERKRLRQFLTAVRMMVGEEEHENLRNQAATVADAHRGVDSFVDWEAFHADPTAEQILEHILVAIANSFRRFDARRDWFLVVMNANPSAVSTASMAFVQVKPEDRARFAFTERHMGNVFDALFATVRRETFTSERMRRFSKRWNAAPDKVFGPLFVEIARLRQHD